MPGYSSSRVITAAQKRAFDLEQQRVNQNSLGQRIARMLASGATNLLQTAGMRDMQRTMPTPMEGAQVAQALQEARLREAQVPGAEARSRVDSMEAEDTATVREQLKTVSPKELLDATTGVRQSSNPFFNNAYGASLVPKSATEGVSARLKAKAAAEKETADRRAKLRVAEIGAAPQYAEVARKTREDAVGRAEKAREAAQEAMRGEVIRHNELIAKPETNPEEENKRFEAEIKALQDTYTQASSEAMKHGYVPIDITTPGQRALGEEKTAGIVSKRAGEDAKAQYWREHPGGTAGEIAKTREMTEQHRAQMARQRADDEANKGAARVYDTYFDPTNKESYMQGDNTRRRFQQDTGIRRKARAGLSRAISAQLTSGDPKQVVQAINGIERARRDLPADEFGLVSAATLPLLGAERDGLVVSAKDIFSSSKNAAEAKADMIARIVKGQ